MTRQQNDFIDILDGFFDQFSDSGAILFPRCRQIVTEAAKRIMQSADLHYVPGYKITELMADLVNIAATISSEGWLSETQAVSQFQELTAPSSALVKSFLADAAMEKARYEPIMLDARYSTPQAERNAILAIRLKRMLHARQSYDPLPETYLQAVRDAGHHALNAECFACYRAGAMLQFFADMVRVADQVVAGTFDEVMGFSALKEALKENGRLWRLYKGKAPRFSARPGDPLREGVFPLTRANMLYIPDAPGRPRLH